MAGVSYTHFDDAASYKEVITEDDNGTIFIHLEKSENDSSIVDRVANIGKSNFTN
ncbi:hypothetical protein [uncultured Methanobrevibacter sp.]|uniref:hypothetical protein n=1 Tax=uncultured Methanobrevibacter sp. TaxID=253161 RepID=UPI0025CBE4AC|nr:hypothetical protein [uncultured Methanobrevibacter sp.]